MLSIYAPTFSLCSKKIFFFCETPTANSNESRYSGTAQYWSAGHAKMRTWVQILVMVDSHHNFTFKKISLATRWSVDPDPLAVLHSKATI